MFLTNLADLKMHPAVHAAADVARIDTQHTFFAQTHRFDPVFGDSDIDQLNLDCFSPLHAQVLVVAR